MSRTLQDIVSEFGSTAKAKLANVAISGEPEEQLRTPFETLIEEIAGLRGLLKGEVAVVGETKLSDIKTRPDFAVTKKKALIGFVELKAPGKGADPRKFPDGHDKIQWNKLKSLPNLVYSDGNSFSLWRDGALQGQIIHLEGNIETAGAKLAAPAGLEALFADFLDWNPIAPKTPRKLAEVSARLCRLLREEVREQLERDHIGLKGLKNDWRKLLFPNADNEQFADGYAQAVTFGLLIARAKKIDLKGGIDAASAQLRQTSSLIGTALRLLTDDPATQKALQTSLDTMVRVFAEVDWAKVSKDEEDAWLYFYEHFLEVYDNSLRKKTGSYYTPPEVVTAMVRLVDEALRGPLFNRPMGLASTDVTVADPAVGTGTFLLGVLRKIAANVADDQGEGSVPGAISAAADRLIGFELQFGPYAVAQLRLLAEYDTLMKSNTNSPPPPDMKLFVTDTLSNPFVEEEQLPQIVEAVAKSRRDANAIKRAQPITVVIGNPPYKNKAFDIGGWIRDGGGHHAAPMAWWTPPASAGVGTHLHHLGNLYVYFWRWATLKVFGSGWSDATGEAGQEREGIVCFITAAGFLNGPGFIKMREELRRDCSQVWVIDCSPEGHQPEVATRIFQGVQQSICIVLAARKMNKDRTKPAEVRFMPLPKGKRNEKFKALEKLSLHGPEWKAAPDGWTESFLPESVTAWADFVPLADMFDWSVSGVTAHRTWPIAADAGSLVQRWQALVSENNADRKAKLFHPDRDRTLAKVVAVGLGPHGVSNQSVDSDKGSCKQPIPYSFRSFDRQWIIPDHRLISMARPKLWNEWSPEQTYITAPEDTAPSGGPALTMASLLPDLHHYHGRGGRVYPLWRDAQATVSNFQRGLVSEVGLAIGQQVSDPDLLAYIAAVMAHPAFTKRFAEDLVQPGLRLPVTAGAALFREAVAIGCEVIWLHCYGERFCDAAAGRPSGPPRMAKGEGPVIPSQGAIPGVPEPLPDAMEYDPAKKRLHVGKGFIDNVTPRMWAYEVSGKNVLRQWFSYRKRDRTRPIIGDRRPPSPLDSIQPDHWLAEYTTDLLNLLHVLGRLVALEAAQKDLLDRICAGALLSPGALGIANKQVPEEAGDTELAGDDAS